MLAMPNYRVALSITGVIQVEAETEAEAEAMAEQIVPVFLGCGEMLDGHGQPPTVAKPIFRARVSAKYEGLVENTVLHPVNLHHKHGVKPAG